MSSFASLFTVIYYVPLEICHHLLYGANHFLWSGCLGCYFISSQSASDTCGSGCVLFCPSYPE